jgi:kojibiose phosphorylase
MLLSITVDGESVQNLSTRECVEDDIAALEFSFRGKKTARYQMDKLISTFTSREQKRTKEACIKKVISAREQGIPALIENHERKWNKVWQYSDIEIQGDKDAKKALRLNIYHLLIASPITRDIDASIAAKTLSGEWYKGHVFWDTEIYALPLFIFTQPEVARRMLLYRYRRLDKARANAALQGYSGSLWPWESAATGEDETPDWSVNFDDSIIPVYNKEREHHIAGDVVYAVARYYHVTHDEDFMLRYGAEMIFETARFWASRAVFNEDTNEYEIRNVIGPNEFQESVNNNSYTNFLAGWTLRYAADLYSKFRKDHSHTCESIAQKIALKDEEARLWREMAAKIAFRINSNGLIEEFEGYFAKKNVTIQEWDENGMPIWPEDIELAEVKHTQLIKQADVILLLSLFSAEFSDEVKEINLGYYEERTTHKSSLSVSSYAILSAQLGEIEKAYNYFLQAVNVDLANIYGNTELGMHAASIGGAWQIVISGFAGVSIVDDMLRMAPALPPKWQKLRFQLWFRKALIECTIHQNKVELAILEDRIEGRKGIELDVYGKRTLLSRGKRLEVKVEAQECFPAPRG